LNFILSHRLHPFIITNSLSNSNDDAMQTTNVFILLPPKYHLLINFESPYVGETSSHHMEHSPLAQRPSTLLSGSPPPPLPSSEELLPVRARICTDMWQVLAFMDTYFDRLSEI